MFDLLVYNPLYNLLVFFYDSFGKDFGVAIVLLTLTIKFLFIPLTQKQIESQKKMQEIQPKLKEIQQKYKDDKERQSRELMAFYRENKVNPFSGCLPLIITAVFFFAIYRVLMNISSAKFVVDGSLLYSFVGNPENINTLSLRLLDLAATNIPLAVITAVAQYYQIKMMMGNKAPAASANGEPDIATIMSKQMLYLIPGMILVFGVTLPAGMMLYWLVSTLFAIAQQEYILKAQISQNPKSI